MVTATPTPRQEHEARPPAASVVPPENPTGGIVEAERFHYALRHFMRASEEAAHREGLTPQQHQLLLTLKGFPGRDCANISELADRLQACPHGVVGLVDRLERDGLVERRRSETDRRQVFISLTPAGEEAIARLSSAHLHELASMRLLLDRAPSVLSTRS